VLLLGGFALLAWATSFAMDKRARRVEGERLRAQLAELRASAAECIAGVAQAESAFQDFHARVDSLRARVRDYESMDARGVPGAEYGAYLEAFEQYNDSVSAWQGRADALESGSERCQVIVTHHNSLADSVRRIMEARTRSGR
jgi:hypothetical protein